ncbi:MAG: T9SS type A sorting domain-containing protein, partial [Dinghuibacter sp.]|nr:T9SS type A sorting domain-containing protein [Dinghuibacter sp.]
GVQLQAQNIIISTQNTGNQEFRLVVTDANGRLIKRTEMQQNASVSLAGRARGIYFVNIYNQENKLVHSQKVVN